MFSSCIDLVSASQVAVSTVDINVIMDKLYASEAMLQRSKASVLIM